MRSKLFYPGLIAVSAALLFIPFLGSVHLFDWDEVNFAESAREMIVTGDYGRVQIGFQPFWEKPPLFFWLQALAMHVFGIGEFAARLPNALFGIVTLLSFFFIGRRLIDERFGLLWALAYLGSFLPHLYFRSGIIDPIFNYFIFLTVYFLARCVGEPSGRHALRYALFAGIAMGLATITKGPVGLLIVTLSVAIYWVSVVGVRRLADIRNVLVFGAALLVVSSLWFGLETLKNGPWFITEFIRYQIDLFANPVAGHGEPFYYHFVVVGIGCFPISIFALPLLFGRSPVSPFPLEFGRWMLILFWVVMILFSIVTTKIVHYSSLAYFPLSFLAALFICRLADGTARLPRYLPWLLAAVGLVLAEALIALPLVGYFKSWIVPYLTDRQLIASLQLDVPPNGFESLIGVAWLGVLIAALVLIRRADYWRGAVTLFCGTAIDLLFFLVAVVPQIERYQQGPLIDFYQSLAGRDVYAGPVAKSYAQYFYFQLKPGGDPRGSDGRWLATGEIDKPAYITARVRDNFGGCAGCRLIERKGGFVFYLRLPPAK